MLVFPREKLFSSTSDGKLSNGAQWLQFTWFENSSKCCALIIALFTVGKVIAMETVFVVNLQGTWDTNIAFTRPKDVAVSFKAPSM